MDSSNFIKVKYAENGFIEKISWVEGNKVYSVKDNGVVKEKEKITQPKEKSVEKEE